SRRRHTRWPRDWSSDVCSSDLGKKLKAVDKGELSASDLDEPKKKELQPLLDYMKGKLTEIKDVRLSRRLKGSAVCLVADEGEMRSEERRVGKECRCGGAGDE